MFDLRFFFAGSSLFRSAAKFRGGVIEVLVKQRGGFGVIAVQGVVIITCHNGQRLKAEGTADSKPLEDSCHGD
jgi:hypothetical protein